MGRKNSINSRKLMIIKIISIGNKLNTWEQDSINFYLKQLPKNLKIEFVNLKSHQNPNYSESELIKKESQLIMSKLSKDDFIIAFDMNGVKICRKKFTKIGKFQRNLLRKVNFSQKTHILSCHAKMSH